MKIGDCVKVAPNTFGFGTSSDHVQQSTKKFTGTVIYIHERHNWCMVEFKLPLGVVRECFFLTKGDLK